MHSSRGTRGGSELVVKVHSFAMTLLYTEAELQELYGLNAFECLGNAGWGYKPGPGEFLVWDRCGPILVARLVEPEEEKPRKSKFVPKPKEEPAKAKSKEEPEKEEEARPRKKKEEPEEEKPKKSAKKAEEKEEWTTFKVVNKAVALRPQRIGGFEKVREFEVEHVHAKYKFKADDNWTTVEFSKAYTDEFGDYGMVFDNCVGFGQIEVKYDPGADLCTIEYKPLLDDEDGDDPLTIECEGEFMEKLAFVVGQVYPGVRRLCGKQ